MTQPSHNDLREAVEAMRAKAVEKRSRAASEEWLHFRNGQVDMADQVLAALQPQASGEGSGSLRSPGEAPTEPGAGSGEPAETEGKGEISDGYHTFNELYEHRHALFAVACHFLGGWKSKLHQDGTMFPGWFIAGLTTCDGPATYHLPLRLWDAFPGRERERAPEWDGHTAGDVVTRLWAHVAAMSAQAPQAAPAAPEPSPAKGSPSSPPAEQAQGRECWVCFDKRTGQCLSATEFEPDTSYSEHVEAVRMVEPPPPSQGAEAPHEQILRAEMEFQRDRANAAEAKVEALEAAAKTLVKENNHLLSAAEHLLEPGHSAETYSAAVERLRMAIVSARFGNPTERAPEAPAPAAPPPGSIPVEGRDATPEGTTIVRGHRTPDGVTYITSQEFQPAAPPAGVGEALRRLEMFAAGYLALERKDVAADLAIVRKAVDSTPATPQPPKAGSADLGERVNMAFPDRTLAYRIGKCEDCGSSERNGDLCPAHFAEATRATPTAGPAVDLEAIEAKAVEIIGWDETPLNRMNGLAVLIGDLIKRLRSPGGSAHG